MMGLGFVTVGGTGFVFGAMNVNRDVCHALTFASFCAFVYFFRLSLHAWLSPGLCR